jgi:hypothetical protein
MTISTTERAGFGPLEGLPTFTSSTALSTTPVKVTMPTLPTGLSSSGNSAFRVKLVNGSAGATIAWSLVATGASAPSITADYNATTGASAIPPLGSETFAIPTNVDLYVVASAAATSYSATAFLVVSR